MYAISPDNAMNCQIIIYSKKNIDVPELSKSDTVLNRHVIEYLKIRKHYPELCTIDFQNLLEIVVAEFLGHDKSNRGILVEGEGE